jgi:hypothetical protein
MNRLQHAKRLSAIVLRAFSIGVLLAGIAFAAYAGVQWLQTARWQPLTVNGALASWPVTREWIAHPQSWLGLHRVVIWFLRVPVFVVVTLLGLAMVFITNPPPVDTIENRPTWSTR